MTAGRAAGQRVPTPTGVTVIYASYGALRLVAYAPAGLTLGSVLGVRTECARAASSDRFTNISWDTVLSESAGQWFWGGTSGVAAGTWHCSVAFLNERGAGAALSATAVVGERVAAPTGLTFVRMDGSDAVFQARVSAAAWQATPHERGLDAGCRNLGTGALVVQSFDLAAQTDLGGGLTEFRLPLAADVNYRCEARTWVEIRDDQVVGLLSDPYEFTTPPPLVPEAVELAADAAHHVEPPSPAAGAAPEPEPAPR